MKDDVICNFCNQVCVTTYYDAATVYGPWANMCAICFSTRGVGLGTGRGQEYKRGKDLTWKKTAG